MKINSRQWLRTLPDGSRADAQDNSALDSNRWTDTLPKKSRSDSAKKYLFISVLFFLGLIFVPVIKNEARNLQKEINDLQTSINLIKFDLHQANLDHAVITAPENISQLAKKYLTYDYVSYKKSQIYDLNKAESDKKNKKINNNKIAKKFEKKRLEPTSLIEGDKNLISKKTKRWAGFQVLKAFLGIPSIPGR